LVVVAAVVLPDVPSLGLCAVRDSKTLTPNSREKLFGVVLGEARAISVAWAHPARIDQDNILRATLEAMRRAVHKVMFKIEDKNALTLVDGPRPIPDLILRQTAIVDGDHKSLSISAASIIAKVVRDRWMESIDRRYPGYGFHQHKGYGTAQHSQALKRLGACTVHRRSYAPIKKILVGNSA
jgi:ribonuclease HII